jgi:hypothetical protein
MLLCGVAFSCNALGTAIKAFGPTTSYAHLRGLARRVRLSGSASFAFQLIPALLTVAAFYYAFLRLRIIKNTAVAT